MERDLLRRLYSPWTFSRFAPRWVKNLALVSQAGRRIGAAHIGRPGRRYGAASGRRRGEQSSRAAYTVSVDLDQHESQPVQLRLFPSDGYIKRMNAVIQRWADEEAKVEAEDLVSARNYLALVEQRRELLRSAPPFTTRST